MGSDPACGNGTPRVAVAHVNIRCCTSRRRAPVSAATITSLGAYELRNTYACCACCEAKFHLGCMTPETQRAVLSREPYFCSADCASVSKQLAEVCGRGMMKVRRGRRMAVNTQASAGWGSLALAVPSLVHCWSTAS